MSWALSGKQPEATRTWSQYSYANLHQCGRVNTVWSGGYPSFQAQVWVLYREECTVLIEDGRKEKKRKDQMLSELQFGGTLDMHIMSVPGLALISNCLQFPRFGKDSQCFTSQ